MCKKMFIVAILCVFSIVTFAQKDVTKFLGIPVDGTKSEMFKKIRKKGFVRDYYGDVQFLKGQFNGKSVRIYLGTNKDKVYRVQVSEAHCSNETDIKITYNKLCRQFFNNPKYRHGGNLEDILISDNEDISYEMEVNNKRYDAYFFQDEVNQDSMFSYVNEQMHNKYAIGVYDIKLLTDEENFTSEVSEFVTEYRTNTLKNKIVWFMISELDSEYYITIFYDNCLNQAKGEDL